MATSLAWHAQASDDRIISGDHRLSGYRIATPWSGP